MCEKRAAADFLLAHDYFEILTHDNPDGDTLGSGFALCLALQRLGKKARVITTTIPQNLVFLSEGIVAQDFAAETIISVDVADEKLLGDIQEAYSGKIDLCIDHHCINKVSATRKCIDCGAAANCEILFDIFGLMGISIKDNIAKCLYTGLATDTGCFQYGNTTSRTLRIAADLLDAGVPAPAINKALFNTKSKKKLRLEQAAYRSMEFYADDRCAFITLTREMLRQTGTSDEEAEGLANLPRQIEGVCIGITVREKEEGLYKISVRSDREANAAAFCARFGGGGHMEAAGCSLRGTLVEIMDTLKTAVDQTL